MKAQFCHFWYAQSTILSFCVGKIQFLWAPARNHKCVTTKNQQHHQTKPPPPPPHLVKPQQQTHPLFENSNIIIYDVAAVEKYVNNEKISYGLVRATILA